MDVLGVLGGAAVIVTLASTAGLAWSRGLATNLRDQLKDSREENTALKAKRAEDQVLIHDLQAVVRIATGEVHWQAISDLLEHHHASAERHSEQAERHAEHLDELLSQIIGILVQRPPK